MLRGRSIRLDVAIDRRVGAPLGSPVPVGQPKRKVSVPPRHGEAVRQVLPPQGVGLQLRCERGGDERIHRRSDGRRGRRRVGCGLGLALVRDTVDQPPCGCEGRRLAARRAPDQRLPQQQGLGPLRRDLHHDSAAAGGGRGTEQALRVVVDRREDLRRALRPGAPSLGQQVERERHRRRAAVLQEAGVDLGPRVGVDGR